MEPLSYEKRGYLNEPFRLFHLADNTLEPVNYHYHTFHKIVILLAGRANYAVEGERYALLPGDFVLVGRGSIHRPETDPETFYERMILYISPEFLQTLGTETCNLEDCFRRAQQEFRYVYSGGGSIKALLLQLEQSLAETEYGAELLQRALFTEFMVKLNRLTQRSPGVSAASGDPKIVALLQHINLHLTEPLPIEDLAAQFYISKFHLMRRFKQETGYTIHSYIAEKRLLLARELLRSGKSVQESCEKSGYADYSTFARAYRKRFGCTPSREFT